MTKPRQAAQFVSLGLMTLTLAISALAQNNKGTIVGTVKDPNDALVTAAKATALNIATGESREANTSDDGTFTIPNLDPGKYRVTVESSGFQTVVFEGLTVETNARQPLDVKFAIAGGAGSVTITADSAPLVESETSVRGDLITGRQVTDLPIPQRNFTLLAALSPGVTRPTTNILGGSGNFTTGGEGTPGNSTESTRFRESGGSVLSANGQRVTNNNFTLDGVDNNESQFGQIGIFPSPDAIAEFKVETSVPSAESGRAGGAIVSTTFKSGSNDIHGTAYEFYTGHFAGARPTNNPNPPNFVQHNFGFNVGGPVFLPRPGEGGSMWYDGRNRSFFFFNYQGQRSGTPAFGGEFGQVTVPTARIRAGDFSELLEPTVLVQYRTPAGLVTAPRGTIFNAAGTPYAGNIIPIAELNPVALAYFNAYPLPTQAGLENNYHRNRSERGKQDGYDVKIDHTQSIFGAQTSFFGRYSKQDLFRNRDNNFPLGTSPNNNDLASGFGAGNEFGNTRQIALGATSSFTPTVINDMRGGWTRVEIGIFNPGIGGALGFSATNAQDLGTARTNICGVVCSGTVLLGVTGNGPRQPDLEFVGDGGPFFFTSNNFYYGDTLTLVKGNQTWKAGGDLRVRQNANLDANRSGSAKANIVYTTGADIIFPDGHTENLNRNGFFSGRRDVLGGLVGPQDTGNGYANFLLGYSPTETSRGIPGGIPFLSSKEIGIFVQDDWKYSETLTLNLGLRYDMFTPQTERFDAQSNFNPTTRLLERTTSDSPHGRGGADTDKNNFGPRIGFAYSGLRDDRNLVLRGGYGLLYSTDVSGQQPLSANFLTGGRYDRQVLLPGVNIATGAPVPSGSVPATPTYAPSAGATIFFNDPEAKTEIFHQYNLTLQYEFRPSWLAEAAYVGTRARNLLVVRNIGSGGGGSRQIAGIDQIILTENKGSSWYDALQTKLEKRFSKGLSILSSYTWSHAIDNTPGGFCIAGPSVSTCGPANPVIGLSIDKGNSDLDVRHRFTFANVYDLPFGRGRRFGGGMPTGLDLIAGGWQFNNVITIQSGPVFSVFADGARVDVIGDPFSNVPAGRELNPAAFRTARTPIFATDPGGPKFGNLGRNVFRGQQQEYWDASLFKNIPARFISEAFNVQLRIQAYNLLNHINHFRPARDLNNTGDFGIDKANQRQRQLEFSVKVLF